MTFSHPATVVATAATQPSKTLSAREKARDRLLKRMTTLETKDLPPDIAYSVYNWLIEIMLKQPDVEKTLDILCDNAKKSDTPVSDSIREAFQSTVPPFWWKLQEIKLCAISRHSDDEKETTKIPLDPTITATLNRIFEKVHEYYRTYGIGLPLNEKQRYLALTMLHVRNNIAIFSNANPKSAIVRQSILLDRTLPYVSTEERVSAFHQGLIQFYRAMPAAGEDFSICRMTAIRLTNREFSSEFYQTHSSSFAMETIEVFCALINYALETAPKNQISKLAAEYFGRTTVLFNELQSQSHSRPYVYTPLESRVIALYLYTKIRYAYHIERMPPACMVPLEKYKKFFPNNSIAALVDYKRVTCDPKSNKWYDEIKEAISSPPRKKPTNILTAQYGRYDPISDREQKRRIDAINQKTSRMLDEKNISRSIEELFRILKTAPHPLEGLYNAIKFCVLHKNNTIFFDLALDLTQLYCIYNYPGKLKKFEDRFFLPEKEKKLTSPARRLPPTEPNRRHPPADMRHLRKIVEGDHPVVETKAVAATATTPTATTVASSTLKTKKAKKKVRAPRKRQTSKDVSSSSSSSESYSPIEFKGVFFAPSVPVASKLSKLRAGISPANFFRDLLSPVSRAQITGFMEHSPVTLGKNNMVMSRTKLYGSTATWALITLIGEPPGFRPEDIDLCYDEQEFCTTLKNAITRHNFKYMLSRDGQFSQYSLSDLVDDKGNPIPCQLTIVPDTIRKSPNSIPISKVMAVMQEETRLFFFQNLTKELKADIVNKIFRVEIPSILSEAPHEAHFLLRFSKYYLKLVCQSEWKSDKDTTVRVLQQDFLIPYLTKIKAHGEALFHREMNRLIAYHQKILASGNAQFSREVSTPMILAFFTLMLKEEEPTQVQTIALVLTTSFLEYISTADVPPSLLDALRSFKAIKKPDGLRFDLNEILERCCVKLTVPTTATSTGAAAGGMFRSTATTAATATSPPVPAKR